MTIIIQNLDEATTAWIDRVARQRGVSVEDMVVELIHKGLNLEQESVSLPVYDDLDALAGTWSDTEFDEFLRFQSRKNVYS